MERIWATCTDEEIAACMAEIGPDDAIATYELLFPAGVGEWPAMADRWMRWRESGALLVAAVALGVGVTPMSSNARADTTLTMHGYADNFGPPFGVVAGATVRVVELPSLTTITDANGEWELPGLPVGSTVSFELIAPNRPPVQTRSFTLTADLDDVAFQSPNQAIFDGFAGVLQVTPDPTRCSIAATVTRRGFVYRQWPLSTHGEPYVTVTLSPVPAGGVDGPVYFNLLRGDLIWPDRTLSTTTADGGVVFVNVPPGTYVLHADKAGVTIPDITVTCRPGVLTNASPPFGLNVTDGGLDPSDDPLLTSTTTSSSPSTASTNGSVPPVLPRSRTLAVGSGAPRSVGSAAPTLVVTPRFAG